MYESDISVQSAISAFHNVSFSPERNGERVVSDYDAQLQEAFAKMQKQAEIGKTQDLLQAEFDRYRDGLRKRTSAWLASKSRCISSMITGPANFPVRRAQKRNDIEHKRCGEMLDFAKQGLEKACWNLRPDLHPIMAGDSDAVSRLEAELQNLQESHAEMKLLNAAHAAYKRNPASLETANLTQKQKDFVISWKPVVSWENRPFPAYSLSNNSANIRRVAARLESLKKAKATPDKTIQREGLRIEDCPADNRIRLFFDGKPDADIRARLKSNGFRWAPSIGAWQAYRNHRAMETAQGFVNQYAKVAE